MAGTIVKRTQPTAVIAVALCLLAGARSLAQGVAPTPPQDAQPAVSQTPTPAPENNPTISPGSPAAGAAGSTQPAGNDLDSVLKAMDEASTRFKAAQANIQLETYTAALKGTGAESDTQSGRIYFRRKGRETQVALWIEKPHAKQAVVKGGKVTFFDPGTKQVTERDLGSNKQDVEAVMNLGFGGGGKELLKEYEVTLNGWENVDGVRTAQLNLVAKSESLRRLFSKLVLWIDPKRDVAVRQQRFQGSGDYQLTHYTNIKMFSNIPDDKFTVSR